MTFKEKTKRTEPNRIEKEKSLLSSLEDGTKNGTEILFYKNMNKNFPEVENMRKFEKDNESWGM